VDGWCQIWQDPTRQKTQAKDLAWNLKEQTNHKEMGLTHLPFSGFVTMNNDDLKEKLLAQLKQLKVLPNFKEVKALRKRLQSELQKIKDYEKAVRPIQTINLNQKRSGKLRRYHNYIRQIRNNFPNLTYNQIRKQLKERKQGLEVKIPDAVWQNPSP